MTEQRHPLISLKSATKTFGRFAAVSDMTFTVTPGEIVGFVGANGAGKTTTISMIMGFIRPSKGIVELFGEPLTPTTSQIAHHRMGYAAGDMDLPEALTGQQYLTFVMNQYIKSRPERLTELADIFKPQLHKKIGSLSRGNRQKIALIAAFINNPELVVLDEPTSGLDPIMQTAFLDLVRAEQAKGTTIFMSSHYLQEVAEVCTRVLLMKNGELVEDLSEERLREAAGKVVTVTTPHVVPAPEHNVKHLSRQRRDHEVETTFVYSGPMKELQVWIAKLDGVRDIEITERTLEAEFRNLYKESEEQAA